MRYSNDHKTLNFYETRKEKSTQVPPACLVHWPIRKDGERVRPPVEPRIHAAANTNQPRHIPQTKTNDKMSYLEQNNAAKSTAFARIARAVFVACILLLIGHCAFGQRSLVANFSLRIHGDTTEVQHRLFDVSIDSALIISVRGKNETYFSRVTGAEIRPTGLFYILEDGTVHYVQDKAGKLIVWTGSKGKWILYDYMPIGVNVVTKRGNE